MMNKLIGVSGFARSGKDTFCSRASKFLEFHGHTCKTYSFANALKGELNDLLLKHTGISAFTEVDSEKDIIRPLLVTYGTDVRRRLNSNCWIESIQEKVSSDLSLGHYVFISDVRFLNEAEWVKSLGGYLFNIQRHNVSAANSDESNQYKLFNKLVDYKISWPTFEQDSLSNCDDYVVKLFNEPSAGDIFPISHDFIDLKSKKNLEAQTQT